MNVLGKEVCVLRDTKVILESLNEVHELKVRTDDIKEKLNLIINERGLVIEFFTKIELLHSILMELFLRRKTHAFDKEVQALLLLFVQIEKDLIHYVKVLEVEAETNQLNIAGEKSCLKALDRILNLESVESAELLKRLDELGGVEEVLMHKRIEEALENYGDTKGFFKLKPLVRLCVSVALYGAVACGSQCVVYAPKAENV